MPPDDFDFDAPECEGLSHEEIGRQMLLQSEEAAREVERQTAALERIAATLERLAER
jgi:hypothetical protein